MINFLETFKSIGINTLVGSVSNLGAKQIGTNYHTGNINRTEQLLLHARLGALTSELTGNDALTGAVSGVMGEVVGEIYAKSTYGKTYNFTQQEKDTLKEIGGLSGAISSLIVGKVQGLEDDEMADNIFNGQRLGKNAVENNLTVYVHGTWSDKNTFSRDFKESMNKLLEEDKTYDFSWTGGNTDKDRQEAAKNLLNFIEDYEFTEGEDLNFVAHSHGGNVVKIFSNLYDNYDNGIGVNAFNIDTPNREYKMNSDVNFYNIYNVNDIMTQEIGGGTDIEGRYTSITDWEVDYFKFNGFPSRIASENNVKNVEINQEYTSYSNSYNSFIDDLKNENKVTKIITNLIKNVVKDTIDGQLKNHTDVKNKELVNDLYNYISNEDREREKNLKTYNNIINNIKNNL